MNSQVKEKWIAALRSGEYAQASERLRSNDGFCCLGVLCDLYAQEPFTQGWKFNGEYEESPLPMDYWYFDGESEFLPQSVMEWAGLSLPNPLVKLDFEEEDEMSWSYRDEISNLNDSGYSFTELADIIEKQL
jgi:hypothetical protein